MRWHRHVGGRDQAIDGAVVALEIETVVVSSDEMRVATAAGAEGRSWGRRRRREDERQALAECTATALGGDGGGERVSTARAAAHTRVVKMVVASMKATDGEGARDAGAEEEPNR